MSDEEEARRTLKRLEEQSEKLLGAPAADGPGGDRIEILGKRIARVIAYGLAAWLIYALWSSQS
jgi:hypothetical protein